MSAPKNVDRWVTAALFVALASLQLPGVADQPANDDSRFYVPAAAAYARWLGDAVTLRPGAWSQSGIDAAFAANREHPPVAKYAMGLGWLLFHRGLGFAEEIACRIPVVLLWALVGALLYRAVGRVASRFAGLVSAGAWATLPRLGFEARAETLDMPMAALGLVAVLAGHAALERPSWGRLGWATITFALAFGTKLNAPFLAAGLVAYALIVDPPRRSADGVGLRLPRMPWLFLAIALLSPLITWGLWPWLWHDPAARFAAYLDFHLHHYGIYFYYLGQLYGDAVAPWHAPWVMLLVTTPVGHLGLAVFGALRPLVAATTALPGIRRPDNALVHRLRADPALRLGVLAAVQLGLQLGALSLPNVPVYGGIKLFLPALPMLALLVGLGAERLRLAVHGQVGRSLSLAPVALSAALLLPGLLGTLAYRGHELSYYNEYIGGIRGGTTAGFERQYYDLAYPRLAATLATLLPNGGRVAIVPNPKEYGPHLHRWQRDGALPPGVRLVSLELADVVVLTHERRWREYPELSAQLRRRPVLGEETLFGVPLWTAYGRD